MLAVLLKEVGVNNVICFTYGSYNHPEVVKSKEVAEKLGFKWLFCEYTKEKWFREYNSDVMLDFLNYSSGSSIKPHIMDFIAVKELFSTRKFTGL